MGEAPDFSSDDLNVEFQNGFDFKAKGCKTITTLGHKSYVIGAGDDEPSLAIGIRIFDKSLGKWLAPPVLGTKPQPCKSHSAVLVNEDRILFIKSDSTLDDCTWFLEVDTHYVREQSKILGTEVVAWSKGVRGNAQKPIVISGPSGVGKGTIISKLMTEFPSMFGFSVSHTTRAPRDKEKNGVHYHFTERTVMEKDIKEGKFLEFASVHGNLYGTSIEAVEVVADAGKRCILDIDVQGARSVKKTSSVEAIFIFICPPSMKELEKRLRARGTETEEQILKRLRNAEAEIEQGKSSGLFDHILYNDDLEECYAQLKELVRLNSSAVVTHTPSPKGVNLPVDKLVKKTGNQILVNYGTSESQEASNNLIVLDVSSLKGGAPGRTRGLEVHYVDAFANGLDGMTQLS